MYLPKNIPFREFFAALVAAASTVVEAATKKVKEPAPSIKNTPNNINPKAQEKYWKEFVQKYESVWSKYKKEVDRQWACCVAIWVNYCVKRKIQPFSTNANQVGQETKEKLEDRVEGARRAQIRALDVLQNKGVRRGIISKFLKETFRSIEEKKPGEFIITTQRAIRLDKTVEWDSREFRLFMNKSNFQRKMLKYVRTVKTNADLVVMMDEEIGRPVVIFRNILTKAYAEMLLNIPSSRDNKDTIKKGLTKYWKALIRRVV